MTTITIQKDLLEQAIEALYWSTPVTPDQFNAAQHEAAITNLRAALAAQPSKTRLDGGKTGYPPGMLQDDDSRLSKWLSQRGNARQLASQVTIAAQPSAPAWHDAPNSQGIWICDEVVICYEWTAHNIEILDQFDPGDGLRWFGPISPDTEDTK